MTSSSPRVHCLGKLGGQGFNLVIQGLITGSWGNLPTLSPQPHPRLGVTLPTPPRPLMGSGLGLDDSRSAVKEDSLPCTGLVGFLEPPRAENPGPVQELLTHPHTPLLFLAKLKSSLPLMVSYFLASHSPLP